MAKQTPADTPHADLPSQRAKLVHELAWLVVRRHRRRRATRDSDQTRRRTKTRKRPAPQD